MKNTPKDIVDKVLSMDDQQLKRFLERLSPGALEHLEILLDDTENSMEL